jgi:hypothetical protein
MNTIIDIPVVGQPTDKIEFVNLPLDSIEAQRQTKSARISKYLKEVGSFNWNLFGIITVAKLPNQPNYLTLDGGHRLTMVQEVFGENVTVPARVIHCADQAEAATLFHQFNGTASTSVNPEERFVAQVKGGYSESVHMATAMDRMGLKVVSNPDKSTGFVGDPHGRVVKIGKFKALFTRYPETVERAVKVINDAYDNIDNKTLSPMLLEGVVYLFNFVYNHGSEYYDEFEGNFGVWLGLTAQLRTQRNLTYPQLRKDNHYGVSIAKGLYDDYFDWLKANDHLGAGNNGLYPVNKQTLNDLYKNAGRNED